MAKSETYLAQEFNLLCLLGWHGNELKESESISFGGGYCGLVSRSEQITFL